MAITMHWWSFSFCSAGHEWRLLQFKGYTGLAHIYSLCGEIRALDTSIGSATLIEQCQLHELAVIVCIHSSIPFSILLFHSIFQSSS